MTACGLSSQVPSTLSDGGDQTDVIDEAVFIKVVNQNSKGTKVQCQLNPVLDGYDGDIPVFIEFEGEKIETKEFKSRSATVPFTRFKPSRKGQLKCVIVFADAEFESRPLQINSP